MRYSLRAILSILFLIVYFSIVSWVSDSCSNTFLGNALLILYPLLGGTLVYFLLIKKDGFRFSQYLKTIILLALWLCFVFIITCIVFFVFVEPALVKAFSGTDYFSCFLYFDGYIYDEIYVQNWVLLLIFIINTFFWGWLTYRKLRNYFDLQ
ncbi:hypothetical protein [Dysgonomonas sp. 520]|uniref:hypothetical protein n=1 Tax=Dysgonomonas sp. 520 TaxID=2302931 RepID=UPI0013D7BAFD|nr:hypothetical protein [Dysgonomonas sp. 520]NDW11016.1 hypothetical protein [Dysgonomonas sp. 520]